MTAIRNFPNAPLPPRSTTPGRWRASVAGVCTAFWHLLAGLGRTALPRAMTPTQEAQRVREMALQYRRSDRRFADELYAAADRHERLHGVE